MSMLAMVGLGIGELIGGYFSGRIIDRNGKKAGVLFVILTSVVAYAFAFSVVGVFHFNYLSYIMTLTWGI